SGIALRELEAELDALRLSPRKRSGGLPELHVAQPDIEERLQLALDGRDRVEKDVRLLDRHLEHFLDVAALVLNFERFTVVAPPMTHIAWNVDVGQKMHLHLEDAVALTG